MSCSGDLPDMVYLSRIFWAFGHLLWSVMALLVVTISRRGGVLVFTHYHDVDADGRDQQMGPLVDELVEGGASLVEVCRIPLGPALLDALRLKKRLVLSQAALLDLHPHLAAEGSAAAARDSASSDSALEPALGATPPSPRAHARTYMFVNCDVGSAFA